MKTKQYLLAAPVCLALVSCGGGGSDPTPQPPSAPTAASPAKIAACFQVDPTAAFKTTGSPNNDSHLLVRESVDGVMRDGEALLTDPGGLRTEAHYWSTESDRIRFLSLIVYDLDRNNTVSVRNVYSDTYFIPLTMQVGQPVSATYLDTVSYFTGPLTGQVFPANFTQTWTLVAIEDLVLGGKTFVDTCKFTILDTDINYESTSWYARGFGLVKWIRKNASGTVTRTSTLSAVTNGNP